LKEKIEGRLKGRPAGESRNKVKQAEKELKPPPPPKKKKHTHTHTHTPRASISNSIILKYTQTPPHFLPLCILLFLSFSLLFLSHFFLSLTLSSHSTPDFAKVLQQPVLGLKGCADE
jgi:hypothetical protein